MRDPVCGMDVQPDSAAATETHRGQTYYFCCKGCAAKFRAGACEISRAQTGGNRRPKPRPDRTTRGEEWWEW